MWHLGQKAVCVNNRNIKVYDGEGSVPVVGEVYTVTGIDEQPDGSIGLQFDELGMLWYHFYFAWRFRPVAENKTDIPEFKALLNPVKERVDA